MVYEPVVDELVDIVAVKFVQDLVAIVFEELDVDIGYAGFNVFLINLLRTFAKVADRISVAGYDKYRKLLRNILECVTCCVIGYG